MTKNDYYELVMEAYKPAETLIGMVPADKLEWRPGPNFMSLGQLIEHISHGMGDDVRCLITNHWPFTPEQMLEGIVITSYSIHYTKLYDAFGHGSDRLRSRDCSGLH